MFAKARTKKGKRFTDYTFKINDTLFQIRKIDDGIDALKINGKTIPRKALVNYSNRVNQLIALQDKVAPDEQPNAQPRPRPQHRPKPNPLESEPVEINGKIPYDANKKGTYLSGDVGVYYANGYTIVKRKEKMTKIYYRGDKIPEKKWSEHQLSVDRIIKESIRMEQ